MSEAKKMYAKANAGSVKTNGRSTCCVTPAATSWRMTPVPSKIGSGIARFSIPHATPN